MGEKGRLLLPHFQQLPRLIVDGAYKEMDIEKFNLGKPVGAIQGAIDFSRIILMRTGSDFDRQYPGETATQHLLYDSQGGHTPSINNIYLAGVKIVEAIVNDWDDTFEAGITPTNYVGDIFGSLGGTPDFGYVTHLCLCCICEMLTRVGRPYHNGVQPLARRNVETRRRGWM